MSDDTPSTSPTTSSLYRAIWRWHFFAGLICAPFFVVLAITGALYLFHDEIERTVFAHRNVVPASTRPIQPASTLTEHALAAWPDSDLRSIIDPASPTSPVIVVIDDHGTKRRVYLDPHTGVVLDTVRADREFSFLVKKIHSLELFGAFPNRLIEAVGGFGLILVVTGVYLWWPRGKRGRGPGGIVTLRGAPGKRLWWRDLHAVVGVFASALIFFLAATGLPWTGVWGETVNRWVTQAGLGAPPPPPQANQASGAMAGMDMGDTDMDDMPGMDMPDRPAHPDRSAKTTGDVLSKVGWTVEHAPVPRVPAAPLAIPLDRAIELARAHGMPPGFELAVPDDRRGVYTAAFMPDDLTGERVIHLDPRSGAILGDVAYADYGPVGRAIEYSISIHVGQRFGLGNQLVMLATCLAVLAVTLSGAIMWWKRRPIGALGVPPYPSDRRTYRVLWLVVIALGLALPVTGLAIVAMIGFDLLIVRTIPGVRRAFA